MLAARTNGAPTIVITGMRRAGIGLLHAMLSEGGIPDAPPLRLAAEGSAPGPGLAIAPMPHANAYHRPAPVIGLFAERATGAILKSIERQNANEGRAPLARFEKRILFASITREFRQARDAAATAFAPMVMFQFESIIADPRFEAERLARLVAPWWPFFDTRRAALVVRRIHANPKLIYLRPRLLAPTP